MRCSPHRKDYAILLVLNINVEFVNHLTHAREEVLGDLSFETQQLCVTANLVTVVLLLDVKLTPQFTGFIDFAAVVRRFEVELLEKGLFARVELTHSFWQQ
jgi:hypothetical protein